MTTPILQHPQILDAGDRASVVISNFAASATAEKYQPPAARWITPADELLHAHWVGVVGGLVAAMRYGLHGEDRTADHCRRVADISCQLYGMKFSRLPADELSRRLSLLHLAASVHDIGKLSISIICHSPLPLTDGERFLIQRHPVAGAAILTAAGLPPEIVAVAAQHHERIDGNGYPEKMKGRTITEFARAVAVADCFEAMTAARNYKKSFSQAAAVESMTTERGHYDYAYLAALREAVKRGKIAV